MRVVSGRWEQSHSHAYYQCPIRFRWVAFPIDGGGYPCVSDIQRRFAVHFLVDAHTATLVTVGIFESTREASGSMVALREYHWAPYAME